jgi:steroid delta-isomerase-like uncharacterized protein
MKIKFVLTLLFIAIFVRLSNAQDADKFKATADKVYSAFNTGNLNELDKYFDKNYNEHTLPPGTTKTGVEGLKEAISGFRTAFPDINFTIVDWQYDPAKMKGALLIKMTGTNSGSFMGMPATNKKIDIMGIDYVSLNSDGMVTEHWGYSDDMMMMHQLGMGK